MAIIEEGYPVLVFAAQMRARALVLPRGTVCEGLLPSVPTAHAPLEPFTMIQGFYVSAAQLAVARGRNPDQPRYLKKVTQTR